MGEDEEILVVTVRCIDAAAYYSVIDKVKCTECGEMTWLSISWGEKKIDRVICEKCFEKEKKYITKTIYVTKKCLDDEMKYLKLTENPSGTDEEIKKRMISYMEKRLGVKIVISD